MMYWLPIILCSYLFFSFAFFGDKLMLSGPPNAKWYTFLVGFLSILTAALIPFAPFGLPDYSSALWITLEAIAYLLGLYTMFLALEKFEVSKVIPVIGAMQPLMILVLIWLFFGGVTVNAGSLVAFLMLLLGSAIISLEKKLTVRPGYVVLVLLSALMFSLDYVFTKKVFLQQPFLQGLVWMRLVAAVLVLLMLYDKKLRSQVWGLFAVFRKKKDVPAQKNNSILFFTTQSAGGIAALLQSLAISLAPVSYLPIVNSLRGIQYVFLFIITIVVSVFFPKVLHEDISQRVVIQKTAAIVLIMAGLAILVFY